MPFVLGRVGAVTLSALVLAGFAQPAFAQATIAGRVSEVAAVTASTDAHASLAAIPVVRYGEKVIVRGRLTSPASRTGVSGADVRVTFDPIKGATRTVTVRTDAGGAFAVAYEPRVRTAVSAAAIGSASTSAPTTSSTLLVEAPIRCALDTPRSTSTGWRVPGRCSVKGLHPGTKYLVQVVTGGTWETVQRGRSKTDGFRFAAPLRTRGTHTLRVFLTPTPRWVATSSHGMKVRL